MGGISEGERKGSGRGAEGDGKVSGRRASDKVQGTPINFSYYSDFQNLLSLFMGIYCHLLEFFCDTESVQLRNHKSVNATTTKIVQILNH